MENKTVKTGIVKLWWEDKGFGFAVNSEDSKDVFIHWSNIIMDGRKKLTIGDKVEFELNLKDGKLFALNVKVVK